MLLTHVYVMGQYAAQKNLDTIFNTRLKYTCREVVCTELVTQRMLLVAKPVSLLVTR